MNVPISLSCNRQKLETTRMSFSRWTVKVWYRHAHYSQKYKGTSFWFLQPLRWTLLREKVKSLYHRSLILWDSCNDIIIEIEVTWGLPGSVEREGGGYQGAVGLCWGNSLDIDCSAGYRHLWLWEHLLELSTGTFLKIIACRNGSPDFSLDPRDHGLLCTHRDFSFEFFWLVRLYIFQLVNL